MVNPVVSFKFERFSSDACLQGTSSESLNGDLGLKKASNAIQ